MSSKARRQNIYFLLIALAMLAILPAMRYLPFTEPIYRFPMEGNAFLLAGTFGELRSNHFHSGIDIKTGSGIGMPLFAVRDGYVYRVKVSPVGFGKAVYIRHTDGTFAVYGHMNGFNDLIEELVYQKQYASKQFEQEIYLDEGQLPVVAGQLIGFSGNTGASSGPHLHFEIRDPQERITNPLLQYKRLVADHVKPIVNSIAFEPLTLEARADGKFEKLERKPEGNNGEYKVNEVVKLWGKVGLEYDAFDQLDGAANHCGVNYARLFLDGKQIYQFALDTFSFDDKRFINVHFDYQFHKREGRKYQRSYIEAGNHLPCYKAEGQGAIELQDDLVHSLRLELADAYWNMTTVHMQVQRGKSASLPTSLKSAEHPQLRGYAKRNVFVARLTHPSEKHLAGLDLRTASSGVKRLAPAYLDGNDLVYLVDLATADLPQSLGDPAFGILQTFNYREMVMPDKDNVLEEGEMKLFFPSGSTFDSLRLNLEHRKGNSATWSDIYVVGSNEVPLFKSFVLSFEPSPSADFAHAVVAKKVGNGWAYVGNEHGDDGSIHAACSDFGTYTVMADSAPPSIRPLNFKDGSTISASQGSLQLAISDGFSGINSQKILCTIDGRWELFEFDAKSGTITHKLRMRAGGEKHSVQVMVYDQANNLAQASFTVQY
jgi:hypothetical protein